MPIPKVAALKEYVPIKAQPKFCRRSVLLRDRFTCQFCGQKFPSEELTYDHVIPRTKGGKTQWSNIVCACVRCNALKADSNKMKPIRMPRQPTNLELLQAGMEFLPNDVRDDFGSFLYWTVPLEA